jgi:hypothetical protein
MENAVLQLSNNRNAAIDSASLEVICSFGKILSNFIVVYPNLVREF